MIGELRHAWRGLRAMPLVSIVIVASLGLGIGANTTVFSWLQMVRWKPLPGVADAGRLQTIETRTVQGAYVGTSWLRFLDLQRRSRSFAWLLASRPMPLTVGDAPAVERAAGLFVSGNYFEALAQRPAAGRLLSPADAGAPGRQPVAVISHDYWQTRYGAARTAVGSTIRVNGQALEIVGVAPPRFQGTTLGLAFDLWIPATMAGTLIAGSRELVDRSQGGYTVLGRLRAGTAPAAAGAELDAAARELARTHPATDGGLGSELHAFNDPPRGPQRMINGALALLQTRDAAGARRGLRQRRQPAAGAGQRPAARLRRPPGARGAAPPRRLAGAARGAAARRRPAPASGCCSRCGARRPSGPARSPARCRSASRPRSTASASPWRRLLACSARLAAAATPVWLLSRLDPQDTLRLAIRSRSRSPVREVLMGLQVALALLVLVVAGLFFQRFQEGRGLDPGFRAEGVLLAAYDRGGRGATPDDNRAFASRRARARCAPCPASSPRRSHGRCRSTSTACRRGASPSKAAPTPARPTRRCRTS